MMIHGNYLPTLYNLDLYYEQKAEEVVGNDENASMVEEEGTHVDLEVVVVDDEDGMNAVGVDCFLHEVVVMNNNQRHFLMNLMEFLESLQIVEIGYWQLHAVEHEPFLAMWKMYWLNFQILVSQEVTCSHY